MTPALALLEVEASVLVVMDPAPALPRRRIPRERLPSRQQREEARRLAQHYCDYAEAWYAALRAWDVRHPEVVPGISYAPFRPEGAPPVSTLGECGPVRPTALLTPMGEVREVEAARLITEMAASPIPDRRAAGGLLERVRCAFTAPASLLRENGTWASPRGRMAAYAVAVLTLAVALGDRDAEPALVYAMAVLR